MCSAILTFSVSAKSDSVVKRTAAQLTCYLDSRGYATVNILTSTMGLPGGFTVWGFTDFHGNQNSGRSRFDISRYFTEYRLIRRLEPGWVGGIRGLGLQAEYNDAAGEGNSLVRFGVSYKHALPTGRKGNGWLLWRGFPAESDGSGGQVSVVYYLPVSERISINGFADWHLNRRGPNCWVVEPQLSLRLHERFAAHVEYRYNGFEAVKAQIDGQGVAVGLGIVF